MKKYKYHKFNINNNVQFLPKVPQTISPFLFEGTIDKMNFEKYSQNVVKCYGNCPICKEFNKSILLHWSCL